MSRRVHRYGGSLPVSLDYSDAVEAAAAEVVGRYRPLRWDRSVCWYCLGAASGVDHVPPLSRAVELTPEEARAMAHVLVPCCRWCNTVLGAWAEVRLSYRVAYALVRRMELGAIGRDRAAHLDRLRDRWIEVAAELKRRGVDAASVLSSVRCRRRRLRGAELVPLDLVRLRASCWRSLRFEVERCNDAVREAVGHA